MFKTSFYYLQREVYS